MSTNAKSGQKQSAKKARCLPEVPITKFPRRVVPEAEIRPQFARMPCVRDRRAYQLRQREMSQERIAKKLGCSQPTVHRGIARVEKWLATTLPEDRGEYTGMERIRLAVARHEICLEQLQKTALRDYRRSRRAIPVEKVVTRNVVRTKGDEKTVTEETRTEKSARQGDRHRRAGPLGPGVEEPRFANRRVGAEGKGAKCGSRPGCPARYSSRSA